MARCLLPKQFILNQEGEEQILDAARVKSIALISTVAHNRIGRCPLYFQLQWRKIWLTLHLPWHTDLSFSYLQQLENDAECIWTA